MTKTRPTPNPMKYLLALFFALLLLSAACSDIPTAPHDDTPAGTTYAQP